MKGVGSLQNKFWQFCYTVQHCWSPDFVVIWMLESSSYVKAMQVNQFHQRQLALPAAVHFTLKKTYEEFGSKKRCFLIVHSN